MSDYNLYKGDESQERGLKGEKSFEEEVMKPRDWNYRLASKHENRVGHFDFKVEGLGTIDVKGIKKISRSHSETTEDFIWLELKNNVGLDGWVKAETLDYIAFERKNDFVLVARKLLLNIINEKCNLDNVVSKSSQGLYNLYKRRSPRGDGTVTQDAITMIKMSDVTDINSECVTIYKKIKGEKPEKKYYQIELL